ncbi:MAG: septum formation initiator family protein [Thermoanaerobacteraceae bacterium]|nr:septum formation initiator family protein [Thermoanaerobacteraceae bacterium]
MKAYKYCVYETYQLPQPKPKIKRRWRFRWKPGSLLLIFILGYVLFSFGQVYYKIYQLNTKKAALVQELKILQQENRALQEKLRLVQTDSYIEKLAREELGLVKPGEKVLVPALPGDVKPLRETDSNRDIRD